MDFDGNEFTRDLSFSPFAYETVTESYITKKIEKEWQRIKTGDELSGMRFATPITRDFIELFAKNGDKTRTLPAPDPRLIDESLFALHTYRTPFNNECIHTMNCAVAILFLIRDFFPPGMIGQQLSVSVPLSIAPSLFKPNLMLAYKRISRLISLGLCITSPIFLRGVWTCLTGPYRGKFLPGNPHICDAFRDLTLLALSLGASFDFDDKKRLCYSPGVFKSLHKHAFSGTPSYITALQARLCKLYGCLTVEHKSEEHLEVLMCDHCRGVEIMRDAEIQYKHSVSLFDILCCAVNRR